ncbi:MAG TPA: serine hydrolase domain-containing protein [Methylomirabilota bacterium]|nr:serine hydrolase domain-containing protein [Methylomirabilota bacterium]
MNALALLLVTGFSLLFFSGAASAADPLPRAKAEDVGLSTEKLDRIGRTLRADVERGRIPGAVVIVARKGRIAYVDAVGFRDKAAGAAMPQDAIFRIASMTKPLVSVATMMLYEEGRLFLSDPVSKYIPELANRQVGVEKLDPATGKSVYYTVPADSEMTIQDLLRHTSGFTYGNRGTTQVHKLYEGGTSGLAREGTAEQFIERLAKLPLLNQPGTKWEYGVSTDVLGRVVEVVAGKPLGQVLAERIFRPLKMTDTGFVVAADRAGRLAQALAIDPDTGKEIKLFDPTVQPKFECGGGCGVSTAGDYVRFTQMLLNRGSLDGARILGRKTVEYMTTDHLGTAIAPGPAYSPGPGYGFGLGFAVRKETGVAPVTGSAGDYNWGGAFGTGFWVDPKEELTVVFMAQAPGPIRVHYRQLLKTLVLQAIE